MTGRPSPYFQRTCQLVVFALALGWMCLANGIPWYSAWLNIALLYWTGKGIAMFLHELFK